jgi:transcriptional regulator with XRE-family HTH domain
MEGTFFWRMVALEVGRQKTSFEWLYQKTKVAKGTFSSWKTRNILPRVDVAFRIAEALGVSVEYLLTGRDQHKLISNIPVHTMLEDIAKELVFFDPFDVETLKMLISSMAQRYRKTPPNHELI